MTQRRLAIAPVTAALLAGTLGTGSLAAADEPTAQELQEQIKALQQQVQQLQSARDAPTTRPAEKPADPAQRALADAEERAAGSPLSLMQDDPDPFIAGHDGKFILASPDGDFTLNPNFQLQLRHVTNISNEGGDSFSDVENGFEIRRLKIGFKGNAFGPDLNYDIKFAFNRDGGDAVLENAFIDYLPDELFGRDGLGLRAGQFKDMTFQEESVSSSRQLTADRSLVNEAIGGGNTDFIQGAGPLFSGERWSAALLYTDGANTDNTPFLDVAWDYGVAGRADLTLMGDTDAVTEDFTALDTEENSARVGAGFHWAAQGDSRALWHSIDGQYETEGGLGLLAAYYGRWTETDGGDDALDMGGLLQASHLIGDDGLEVFARYDFVIFEEDVLLDADSEDFFHEATVGFNKYFEGHKLKLTIDAVYLPNGNPGSNTGIGLRANDGEFDDQVSLRAQFQLLL